MSNLKSKSWIVAKGGMFLLIVILCAGLIYQESPTTKTALLILLLTWSSARFYYFLFYALEQYVDPSLKYAGILAQLQEIWRRNQPTRADYRPPDSNRPQP